MEHDEQSRGLSTEKAQEILAKNGLQISLREAASVLDLCYKIAILSVKQITRK